MSGSCFLDRETYITSTSLAISPFLNIPFSASFDAPFRLVDHGSSLIVCSCVLYPLYIYIYVYIYIYHSKPHKNSHRSSKTRPSGEFFAVSAVISIQCAAGEPAHCHADSFFCGEGIWDHTSRDFMGDSRDLVGDV